MKKENPPIKSITHKMRNWRNRNSEKRRSAKKMMTMMTMIILKINFFLRILITLIQLGEV